MSNPTENLEQRAADERQRLLASLEELRGRMQETFDVNEQIRQRVFTLAGLAGLASAFVGYGLAGVFSRR